MVTLPNAEESAFPVLEDDPHGGRRQWWGLSKREYFAARAPAEPQPWFKPVMRGQMPEPIMEKREGFMYAKTVNQEEITAWKLEEERQRAGQWPWAWADLVLSTPGSEVAKHE